MLETDSEAGFDNHDPRAQKGGFNADREKGQKAVSGQMFVRSVINSQFGFE